MTIRDRLEGQRHLTFADDDREVLCIVAPVLVTALRDVFDSVEVELRSDPVARDGFRERDRRDREIPYKDLKSNSGARLCGRRRLSRARRPARSDPTARLASVKALPVRKLPAKRASRAPLTMPPRRAVGGRR